MYLPKCGSNKSKFITQQVTSGLISSLGIKNL